MGPDTERRIGLLTKKRNAEVVRQALNRLGLLDNGLKPTPRNEMVVFPLTREPIPSETDQLERIISGIKFEEASFTRRQKQISLLESLERHLPPHLLASLPKSLDVVGDIAILEIPKELTEYRTLIGEHLLKTNPRLRLVLSKAGPIQTEFRVREFERLAGSGETLTVHIEHGCSYKIDVAKAYFSPRLSFERARVASLVRPGETVVDLFAGVGPFSISIAKTQPDARIFAVDLNLNAIKLLTENVLTNRVYGRVSIIHGGAKEVVEGQLSAVADRVIMNLPEAGHRFVDVACRAIKKQGGIVHYYAFKEDAEAIEETRNGFRNLVEKAGRRVEKFLEARTVKDVAPYRYHVAIDALIS